MVYLIMKKSEMSEKIPSGLLPLINARNLKNGFQFVEGEKWNDLYSKYKDSLNNGHGVERTKEGVEYWYLPFQPHEAMINFDELTVLSREEIVNFGFDVEDVEHV